MIDLARLSASLRLAEGLRLNVYRDTADPPQLTIGYGHNLTAKPISQNAANLILQDDIADAQREVLALKWFAALDTVRQNVICELMFMIGPKRLAGFVKMIAAILVQDWPSAAYELMHSTLALQIGAARSGRLSNMLRYGVWP